MDAIRGFLIPTLKHFAHLTFPLAVLQSLQCLRLHSERHRRPLITGRANAEVRSAVGILQFVTVRQHGPMIGGSWLRGHEGTALPIEILDVRSGSICPCALKGWCETHFVIAVAIVETIDRNGGRHLASARATTSAAAHASTSASATRTTTAVRATCVGAAVWCAT